MNGRDPNSLYFPEAEVFPKNFYIRHARRPARVTQADIAEPFALRTGGFAANGRIAPDGTIKLVPVEPTKPEVAKKREIIL